MFFVVLDNSSYGKPSSGVCAQVRAGYGLTMPVLIDPSGTLQSDLQLGGSNHRNVVLTEGMVIHHKQTYGDNAVIQMLTGLLSD